MGCLKQISLHLSLSFHSSALLLPLKLLEILQESVSLLRDLDPTGKAGAFHPACGVHRVAKEAVPRHPAANDARAHIASVDARPNLRERERERRHVSKEQTERRTERRSLPGKASRWAS